jgi:very-short-patch-repair endonuclease
MTRTTQQPSLAAAIWALVRAQHGVIARAQLLDFGLTAEAIAHRIRTGRLHRIHRGVYAVGRRELTREGYWMAAVLSCGPNAFLSHFSAAALWGIFRELGAIEISVLGAERRRPAITVHRRAALARADITTQAGIPVTSVIATLIDIATSLARNQLEAAIREADKRGYVDPEQLREALEYMPPRPGVARLRQTLDRRTFRLTDSELERYYLPISARAGLPGPLTQQTINGERVDFFYPDLGLVIETDGLRYHRTPAQQANDLVRDQKHLASGLTPLRFTHEQVRYEADYVERTLKNVAARIRARHAAA